MFLPRFSKLIHQHFSNCHFHLRLCHHEGSWALCQLSLCIYLHWFMFHREWSSRAKYSLSSSQSYRLPRSAGQSKFHQNLRQRLRCSSCAFWVEMEIKRLALRSTGTAMVEATQKLCLSDHEKDIVPGRPALLHHLFVEFHLCYKPILSPTSMMQE